MTTVQNPRVSVHLGPVTINHRVVSVQCTIGIGLRMVAARGRDLAVGRRDLAVGRRDLAVGGSVTSVKGPTIGPPPGTGLDTPPRTPGYRRELAPGGSAAS